MTYEQALDFWFSRINYEQSAPQAADLKLDRMRVLLQLLGDPQDHLRIIHVAGSKGKGSTSAMLASILRHAGHRTGLFTSPHLCRVEERVQVDGQPISPQELTALLTHVAEVVRWRSADGDCVPPTFFEIATALGFLHFVRRRVDAAVVEVGLGGRFDSTNVCLPAVSLITSISFDHTELLGNRLASIAMEKAGIIKGGRPVISGATAPEAREVIEATCRDRRAPLQQLGVDFHYEFEPGQVAGWRGGDGDCSSQFALGALSATAPPRRFTTSQKPRVRITTQRRTWPWLDLGLLGEHQAANAAVAVACVEQLREQGWHIGDVAVATGLASVDWPARLEIVGRGPLVVLDCAHNVASVRALVETLESSFPPGRRLLIFAGSNDKDLPGMFGVLAPHFAHAFLTCHGNKARAVPTEHVADLYRQSSTSAFTICRTPADAWHAARAQARPDDLICITGSVFLAGALRLLLPVHNKSLFHKGDIREGEAPAEPMFLARDGSAGALPSFHGTDSSEESEK